MSLAVSLSSGQTRTGGLDAGAALSSAAALRATAARLLLTGLIVVNARWQRLLLDATCVIVQIVLLL